MTFKISLAKIPIFSLHYSSSSPTTSMATSSETPFVAEQTGSKVMLNTKPNQNLSLDLDSSTYGDSVKSLIERIRYSPLVKP